MGKLKENETKCSQKLSEYSAKLNDAEAEKRQYIEASDVRFEKLKLEFENYKKEKELEIKNLLSEQNSALEAQKTEINELKKCLDETKCEKETKLKSLTDENRKYLNELENLRRYVNDSMPTIETIKEMTQERQKYEEQILKIKSKNEALINENNALQIRLKSINEILCIQEAQLESASKQFSSNGVSANEKKKQGLLTKWRNKVFEMLVQQKSQEILLKEERSLEDKTIQEFADLLDEEKAKNKILENVVEDKKAELSVAVSDNTVLNQQLSILKEANENLERKQSQDLQSSMELKSFVNSLLKQYQSIEDSFKVANKKLTHLDQRVEFAKNRLGVIKALYSKKEEPRKVNRLDMTTNLSSIHGSIEPNESSALHPPNKISLNIQQSADDAENADLLKNELNKVMQERDMLASKLQADINMMNERVGEMKSEYELVVNTLNKELRELREENEVKQAQIESGNEQLVEKGRLFDELSQKYNELKSEFANLKAELGVEHERDLKQRELEFMDKMGTMNERLNEARREQAKAVVLMRQMERSTNREKERMESLLKSCESYYKDFVSKLQAKVVSLEKERNILMNTLRQQGTVGKEMLGDEQNLKKSHFTNSNSNVNKWLETNTKFELGSKEGKSSLEQNENKIDATSFWFDSKQNIEDMTSQLNEENEEENEDEELNSSDLNKNNEILQQIRKIMGNLELSDAEDEENEDKLLSKSLYNFMLMLFILVFIK